MSNRLGGKQGTAYTGTNANQPPNWSFERRNPNQYDTKNVSIGDLWLNMDTLEPWLLVSLEGNSTSKGMLATWVLWSSSSGDLISLSDDTDVKVFPDNTGNISLKAGSTIVPLRNLITESDPATNDLYIGMKNAITLGDLAPLPGATPSLNLVSGSLFFTGNDAAGQMIQWSRPRGVMYVDGGATVIFRVSRTTNNTLVGPNISESAISNNNSAFGSQCLQSIGLNSLQNTAIGSAAGRLITDSNNTMAGYHSLFSLTTGQENCAFGSSCLANLATGSRNTAIGSQTGGAYVGAELSNILIHSPGVAAENRTLRIGAATGTGNFDLQRSFIQGIFGVTTDVNDAIPVLISSEGQLGTVSSSARYKENIKDIGEQSSKIYDLRPVSFNYVSRLNSSIGLIAEEVEKVIPDMVIYKDGQPETVRYQDLPILLLNEIKKLNNRIIELEKKLNKDDIDI